jgi:hypothetical protein
MITRKSLAIGLIVGLIIGISIGFFTSSVLDLNPDAGYNEIKIYDKDYYIGLFSQQIGENEYIFMYETPYTYQGISYPANLTIRRENTLTENFPSEEFPVSKNVMYEYYGMNFELTQTASDYIVIKAKPIS